MTKPSMLDLLPGAAAECADPVEAVLPHSLNLGSAQGGVGLVFHDDSVALAVTEPREGILQLVLADCFGLSSSPGAAIARALKSRRLRGIRPLIALHPDEYHEEVLRAPALKPAELRQWLRARRKKSSRTVGHYTLARTENHVEVLEVSAPTHETLNALRICRAAGLKSPHVMEPRLAGLGRIPVASRHEDTVLIADLLSPNFAVVHIWREGTLSLYRPIRLPDGLTSPWEAVSREIVRTVTYYKEQNRGAAVDQLFLIQTGADHDAEVGVQRLSGLALVGGQVTALTLPSMCCREPGLGLAANLACLRFTKGMVDLTPREEKQRNLRRWMGGAYLSLVAAGIGTGVVAHRLAPQAKDRRMVVARGIDRAADAAQQKRETTLGKLSLLHERDLALEELEFCRDLDLPVFTAIRLTLDRLPDTFRVDSWRLEAAEAGPELVVLGSVAVDYRLTRSPLEDLDSLLASVPSVVAVQTETISSEIPVQDVDGRLTAREGFRLQVTLRDGVDLP